MPVRVKICGITSLQDAILAVEAGADALGFIFFARSPRCITPDAAAEIIRQLPPFISRVGVFVDEPIGQVNETALRAGLDAVQLHGAESAEECERAVVRAVKAFRVKDRNSLAEIRKYRTAAYLLDSYVAGQLGGTGERFNWDLAIEAKHVGRPVILAGGLTPENVADAAAKVRPYAVDVSSGVESSPGKKDASKVREFIARAKAA